ncbi:hypothetical protein [Chitinophaga sp. SYP-B3965]|uniref:hypothetical protein n=1 Tax=Chitinophaga sp. SYP-B3965 TaxID=2663120 RepID=UPI001563CF74|nr:hypothetical protein [Chitinophaga sp. SYP-B3965]
MFLLLPFAAFAAKGDEEHKIRLTKEIKLNPQARVTIANKYGKIVVNTWDKMECKAEIEITGFGNSEEQARKMAEMVEINIGAASPDNVKIETRYSPSGKKWFNLGKKDSKDHVQVNYVLYVPRNLEGLSLNNSFGDILARELPFYTDISINYGFFDIGKSDKGLKVNMNYTDKARIGKADALIVNANYSSLRAEDVENMKLNSNYSSYVFNKIDNLIIDCNYDDYKIDESITLKYSSNYSDIKLNGLKTAGDFRITYSDVLIRHLSNSFDAINISSTNSDVKIGLSFKTAFRVIANLQYGDFQAKGFEWKNFNNIKKNNSLSLSAITANGTDASPVIKINGSYSDVKLAGE